ncbi:hypothetical protein AnigIFM63309_000161 [Aspergillus niger]|nr:hypothetical protein AnigIFM63309_000161 [Aspergillus niger]
MLFILMAAHRLVLVAMLLATTASAQSHSSTTGISTTSTTTSTAIATHTVQVGSKADPHQYSPHNVSAAVGDIIVFEFYPRNHSVVKADYLAPCVPASGEIFYSGIFNSFNEEDGQLVGPPPTWSLVVNDTEPTFFYCTAIDSCIGNGMNSTMTFESQYNRAKTYPYMLVPGQSIPAEGTISPTSTSTSTSSPSNSPSSGSPTLSTGAIVGIVIGSVAFIAILGALFFLLGRNRVYRQWMSSQDGRHERTARWAALLSPGQSTGKGGSGSNAAGQRKSEMDGGSALVPQSEFSGATVGGLSPPLGQGLWGWDGVQSPQQSMQMQHRVGGMGGGVYQGPHGQGQGQGQVMYEAMVRGPSELDGTGRT